VSFKPPSFSLSLNILISLLLRFTLSSAGGCLLMLLDLVTFSSVILHPVVVSRAVFALVQMLVPYKGQALTLLAQSSLQLDLMIEA
jgi:hypothetical protein